MTEKKTKWTEEQLKAIEHIDGNVLVSASAGSGKTAVMVERIRRLIVEEKIDINRILVLTFTNSAAAEMKAKIMRAIGDSLEEASSAETSKKFDNGETPRERIARLRRQLNLLPSASIGTFHSIELNIVKRHFDELGLTPAVSYINDTIAGKLHQEALDEAFLEMYEQKERENFLDFIDTYGDAKDSDSEFKKELLKFYAEVRTVPDYLDKLREAVAQLVPSNQEDKDEDRLLIDKTYEPASVLLEIIEKLDENYRLAKKNRGKIDFDDAEHFVHQLFKNPDILQFYQKKYKHICVDEYQDCNHLQEAFIEALNKDNILFTVGDAKQSIYRFRRAEPRIFRNRQERYENDSSQGTNIFLPENFRSKPGILDATNVFFDKLMDGYSDEALKVGAKLDLSAMTTEERNAVDWNEDWEKKANLYLLHTGNWHHAKKYKDIYAYETANIIEEKIGKPFYRQGNKAKPVDHYSYSDFAIFARKWSHLKPFAEELDRRGIPFVTQGSESVYERIEVRYLIDILKVIDNRKNDISLLGVMRSPFFGFTTHEMAEIKRWGNDKLKGDISYHEVLLAYSQEGNQPDLKDKIDNLYETLDDWKRLSKFLPLDVMLWQIMMENKYQAFISGLRHVDERKTNVRNFLAEVSDYIANEDSSLFALLKYIDAQQEAKRSEEHHPDSVDAVNLMTIHKSKGLQFPVVFLTLDEIIVSPSSTLYDSKNFQFNKDFGLFVQIYEGNEKAVKTKTSLQKKISKTDNQASAMEEKCLMYVACTRAEDELYMFGSASVKNTNEKLLDPAVDFKIQDRFDKAILANNLHAGDKSYEESDLLTNSSIIKYTNEHFNVKIASAQKMMDEVQGQAPYSPITTKSPQTESVEEDVLREVEDVMNRRYSYEAETETKAKYSVTALANKGQEEESIASAIEDRFAEENDEETVASPVKHRSNALERGIAYHRVMEEIDFSNQASHSPDKIRDIIDDLCKRGIIQDDIATSLDEKVIANFFNWKVIKDNIEAEFEKERAFVMKTVIEVGEDNEKRKVEVMVQGVIDCFFRNMDGDIVLVDYKTDYRTDDLAEKYKEQLRLYAAALRKQYPDTKIHAYLYSFALDNGVKVDID